MKLRGDRSSEPTLTEEYARLSFVNAGTTSSTATTRRATEKQRTTNARFGHTVEEVTEELIWFIILAAIGAGLGKFLTDGDDIPSEPTYSDVTEKTTVLRHYPSGRVEAD